MFDANKRLSERELMELAVKVAEQSIPEDGGPHPMVGAVIARDGHVLQTGFRGEGEPGTHAEEAALAKLTGAQAAKTTVYTTLEPCTSRKKMPCAQRLITKQVERVVIGMLDPNRDIRGQGEWLLEGLASPSVNLSLTSLGRSRPKTVSSLTTCSASGSLYLRL